MKKWTKHEDGNYLYNDEVAFVQDGGDGGLRWRVAHDGCDELIADANAWAERKDAYEAMWAAIEDYRVRGEDDAAFAKYGLGEVHQVILDALALCPERTPQDTGLDVGELVSDARKAIDKVLDDFQHAVLPKEDN